MNDAAAGGTHTHRGAGVQAPALSCVDPPSEARVGASYAIVTVVLDTPAVVAYTAVLRGATAPTVQQMLTESSPHAVAAGTFSVTRVGVASEHTVRNTSCVLLLSPQNRDRSKGSAEE